EDCFQCSDLNFRSRVVRRRFLATPKPVSIARTSVLPAEQIVPVSFTLVAFAGSQFEAPIDESGERISPDVRSAGALIFGSLAGLRHAAYSWREAPAFRPRGVRATADERQAGPVATPAVPHGYFTFGDTTEDMRRSGPAQRADIIGPFLFGQAREVSGQCQLARHFPF